MHVGKEKVSLSNPRHVLVMSPGTAALRARLPVRWETPLQAAEAGEELKLLEHPRHRKAARHLRLLERWCGEARAALPVCGSPVWLVGLLPRNSPPLHYQRVKQRAIQT